VDLEDRSLWVGDISYSVLIAIAYLAFT